MSNVVKVVVAIPKPLILRQIIFCVACRTFLGDALASKIPVGVRQAQ
ncbi:hypothetical protein [Nostoc sp.]